MSDERSDDTGESPPPTLTVVRGDPTDAELAAVLAVVRSRTTEGAAATDTVARRGFGAGGSGWSAYWRTVGAPLAPGPDAWRMSGRA